MYFQIYFIKLCGWWPGCCALCVFNPANSSARSRTPLLMEFEQLCPGRCERLFFRPSVDRVRSFIVNAILREQTLLILEPSCSSIDFVPLVPPDRSFTAKELLNFYNMNKLARSWTSRGGRAPTKARRRLLLVLLDTIHNIIVFL
jgi:hypothetical protein